MESTRRPFSLTLVQRATEPDPRSPLTRNSPTAHVLRQQLFIEALHRSGLPTTLLNPRTKLVPTFPRQTATYVGTRGILLSPRFLLELGRSRTPFVISCEYGVETFLTLVVARLLRRHALVLQEHVGRAGDPLSRFDIHYRRLIGRLASGFVANTVAAKDEIIQLLRVKPSRVFQIMTIAPPLRDELRRDPLTIEPPRSRPLFLYMGRLIVDKNVESLLRAVSRLQEEGLALEVWIGGQGPDEDRLRRIATRLGLDEAVRFIGFVPYRSIGFIYDACDVFVMPSNRDYRNVAVLEAMRFGKPVIDSALDGNAHDTARDRINAFIFDPAEPQQLADCMRKFIVTPGLAREMGAQSEAIMREHTPDSAALGLIAVLRRIQSAGA